MVKLFIYLFLEIILICWYGTEDTFIINVTNSCAAYYFCETHDKCFKDS